MNVETVLLEVTITKETHDELLKLVRIQGGPVGNKVDSLLRRGIEATYEKFPNLKG